MNCSFCHEEHQFDQACRVQALDLMLGSTEPKKMVHRRSCRYARRPYLYAAGFETMRSFADALVATGAWRWHGFCRFCCQDGIDAINDALTREHADA